MPHGTQTIETDRLILRRFTVDDAAAMYKNWDSDPEVTRFLLWDPHTDVEDTRRLLAEWVARYDADPEYYAWAVELAETGEVFGSIGVMKNEDAPDMPDGFEVGYCFARAWWERGYATEACAAVVQYVLADTGVRRLYAGHAIANPASGRVLQKCGFTYTHDGVYHRFNGDTVSARHYVFQAPEQNAPHGADIPSK